MKQPIQIKDEMKIKLYVLPFCRYTVFYNPGVCPPTKLIRVSIVNTRNCKTVNQEGTKQSKIPVPHSYSSHLGRRH